MSELILVWEGFVLPHDRPMIWYSKFSFSLGDRGIYHAVNKDSIFENVKKVHVDMYDGEGNL